MSRFSFLILLCFSFLLCGCGGGGGGGTADASAPAGAAGAPAGGGSSSAPGSVGGETQDPVLALKGSVEFQFVLARAVPGEVDRIRFIGTNNTGQILYGPVTADKAPTVVLEEIPLGVTKFRLEFLSNGVVLGLAVVDVALEPGRRIVVADPDFEDVNVVVRSIEVSPANATLAAGRTSQFRAMVTFTDSTQADLTSSVAWSSSDGTVATINQAGFARAVDVGSATITARLGERFDQTDLTVTAAEIDTLSLEPLDSELFVGEELQFSLTATYSDGTVVDVTDRASWEATNPGLVYISPDGLAQGLDGGHTVVKASFENLIRETNLTLVNDLVVLETLRIEPAQALTAPGSSRQLRAIATTNSGREVDVTKEVLWTSNNALAVQVSNDSGEEGFANFPAQDLGQQVLVTATHPQIATPAESTMHINRFVYIANHVSNDIWSYTSDGSTGHLTYSSRISTVDPHAILMHPNGLLLYATERFYDKLTAYRVNPVNGALAKVSSSEVGTGDEPISIAVHPTGDYVYTANGGVVGDRGVSGFSVDKSNGLLTPLSANPYDAGSRISRIVMHPSGNFLYGTFSDNFDANLKGLVLYRVDPSGYLIRLQLVETDNRPFYLTVSPDGEFVYVADLESGRVRGYSHDSQTGLLVELPNSPFQFEEKPRALEFHPNGRFLYTANGGERSISVLSVDPVNGDLAKVGVYPVILSPSDLRIDPTGRHLYGAVQQYRPQENVVAFTVNPVTGALTDRQDVVAGDEPKSITTTP